MTTPTKFGQKAQDSISDKLFDNSLIEEMPATSRHNFSKTSTEWLEYFRFNRENLLPIPWESSYRLSDIEKTNISNSIRSFQLGESSEGTNLLKAARVYAAMSGDTVYVEALKLFIAEEQRHAADLARFMKQQKIPLAQRHWTDTIFRKLRKLANLELAIVVLLTAELMALVYYKALGEATRSPALKQLCQQILRDENEHIYFQSEQLGKIRHQRSNWQLYCTDLLHHLFFNATLLVVWLDHCKVFRAGGYTFRRFSQEVWIEFDNAIRTMRRKPQNTQSQKL